MSWNNKQKQKPSQERKILDQNAKLLGFINPVKVDGSDNFYLNEEKGFFRVSFKAGKQYYNLKVFSDESLYEEICKLTKNLKESAQVIVSGKVEEVISNGKTFYDITASSVQEYHKKELTI